MQRLFFIGLLCVSSVTWAADAPERPATVLLITGEELAKAWQPFADWKTRGGKSTQILTVAHIDKTYPGQDVQAKIKACVKKHVDEQGTRWVVLGGDSLPGGKGLVPDRDTRHALGFRLRYADIPTDLYYVTEGSWDANGDGVFGDFQNDRSAVTYESIAAIGRIPVRTPADVAAYTAKVIGYETRYPTEKFAKKLLYTCAVPQANYKATMLWDKYLSPEWKDGSCEKFFVNSTPWDSGRAGDYNLSPSNWVERLNGKTASKMHMHGHGFLPGWVLERNQLAGKQQVAQLKNEDAYLLMTTVSCFTGQYDADKDPSITESMLRQPKGGAVAIVAPAREGVPVFTKTRGDPRDGVTQDGTTQLLTRYWINGLSNGLTTGEALARAKQDLAKDAQGNLGFHWVLSELNLLGDPTLDMRANDPVTPTVSAPKRCTVGSQSVTVNAGTPGLTVCLWKGDDVYQVATTNPRGIAKLAVAPSTRGELLLTVSGPSVNTVTRTLPVGPASAADSKPARTKKPRWFK